MVKITRLLITVAMIGVWGWLAFMAIMTASLRGRLTSVAIGILLNSTLAFWYMHLEKRLKQSPDEGKQKMEEVKQDT
ncbi:hypothetical protein [Larkinella sp.]|uniref:hypothetical protein n=1 Tax=Larkinella sp. TaxID=2034517 RepID=UPI003BACBDA6